MYIYMYICICIYIYICSRYNLYIYIYMFYLFIYLGHICIHVYDIAQISRMQQTFSGSFAGPIRLGVSALGAGGCGLQVA